MAGNQSEGKFFEEIRSNLFNFDQIPLVNVDCMRFTVNRQSYFVAVAKKISISDISSR